RQTGRNDLAGARVKLGRAPRAAPILGLDPRVGSRLRHACPLHRVSKAGTGRMLGMDGALSKSGELGSMSATAPASCAPSLGRRLARLINSASFGAAGRAALSVSG